MHGILDCIGKNGQLLVDLNTDCLKDALCGVSTLCAHRLGHSTINDGNELPRCLNGARLSCRFDECGNPLCPAFLTISVENLCKLRRRIRVDNGIGTPRTASVHAHIERRVLHIGEAPLRRIDLRRRDAEIKENAIDLRDPLVRENIPQMAKVVPHERNLTRDIREPLGRCCNRSLVLINADQAPRRRQHSRDAPRMSRTAERAVHIDPVRLNAQCFQCLIWQNADVMKVAHIVIP